MKQRCRLCPGVSLLAASVSAWTACDGRSAPEAPSALRSTPVVADWSDEFDGPAGTAPWCHAQRQEQGATRGATLNVKASDGRRRNERHNI